MARALEETRQFRRDKKRIKGSGRFDWEKLRAVVKELMNDRPLAPKYHDHELSGEYAGVRECHVAADGLLVYDKEGALEGGSLRLIRTGSHSELFQPDGRSRFVQPIQHDIAAFTEVDQPLAELVGHVFDGAADRALFGDRLHAVADGSYSLHAFSYPT